MSALLAIRTIGAETGKVKGTELATDVFLRAVGSQWAESHIIVRTGRQPTLRIDVKVEAFVAV